MAGNLADVITCAMFQDEIFRGYDFTICSNLWISFLAEYKNFNVVDVGRGKNILFSTVVSRLQNRSTQICTYIRSMSSIPKNTYLPVQ